MVYQIKCAWCGKKMGTKEGPESSFALRMEAHGFSIISHSICPACYREHMATIRSRNKKDESKKDKGNKHP
ncbi:hypothetical protein [Desulforapulum autotrophicum]|uniref:hypothetical protein n=1 Tax=Desulforapulum autotrophicum TaxID=2296 RepID=UPI0002F90B51|nr:hypothetical protein [Desulforapulum autotrophicum]